MNSYLSTMVTPDINADYWGYQWVPRQQKRESIIFGVALFLFFQLAHVTLIQNTFDKAHIGPVQDGNSNHPPSQNLNETVLNDEFNKRKPWRCKYFGISADRLMICKHRKSTVLSTRKLWSENEEALSPSRFKQSKTNIIGREVEAKSVRPAKQVLNENAILPSTKDSTKSGKATADAEDAESFSRALRKFYTNLVNKTPGGNPDQEEYDFTDIEEAPGAGVALPYDPTLLDNASFSQACDARNSSFSPQRDFDCQKYLANLNNMRFIKSLPAVFFKGRTIKAKITYAHANIEAIVKISQKYFYSEPSSEMLAYTYDRALNFSRVPTTVFIPLPLDFLRAATSHSPLLSQWFQRAVLTSNEVNKNFVQCEYYNDTQIRIAEAEPMCTSVSVQIWMKDVHYLASTFLTIPYNNDDKFYETYYVPGNQTLKYVKPARLRSIGELLDRYIFDYIIMNGDRGLTEHNSFAYGGCGARTKCLIEQKENRNYGLAKYAYLDQGSSFSSLLNPKNNPFFPELGRIKICRFRRSTFESLKKFESHTQSLYPLVSYTESLLGNEIYKTHKFIVLQESQMRLNKIVFLVKNCLLRYSEEEVFSLPEFDQVRITEEDTNMNISL